jgi:hypothetical protein
LFEARKQGVLGPRWLENTPRHAETNAETLADLAVSAVEDVAGEHAARLRAERAEKD